MKQFFVILLFICQGLHSQECGSASVAFSGSGWQLLSTAPREGSVIESLNAYGVAPTYALITYNKTEYSWVFVDQQYILHSGKGAGLANSVCQFWRPYTGDPAKYVDPTHGQQWKTAYWCSAMHMGYDPKKDVCR